jgi:hypothetical protein
VVDLYQPLPNATVSERSPIQALGTSDHWPSLPRIIYTEHASTVSRTWAVSPLVPRKRNVGGPASAANTNWNSILTSTYHGWLINGATGAKSLTV